MKESYKHPDLDQGTLSRETRDFWHHSFKLVVPLGIGLVSQFRVCVLRQTGCNPILASSWDDHNLGQRWSKEKKCTGCWKQLWKGWGGSQSEPKVAFRHVWASPVKGRGSPAQLLMRKKSNLREEEMQHHTATSSWAELRKESITASGTWHLSLKSAQVVSWMPILVPKEKDAESKAWNLCDIFKYRPLWVGIPMTE